MHLIIVKLLNNFKSSLYKLLIISHYSCRGRKIREKFDDAPQHPVHKTTFERPSHQKRWRHWTRVRGGKRRWRHASPGVARQAAAAGSGGGGRKGARLRALRRVGEERVRGSRRVSGVLQREPDGCRGNWRRGESDGEARWWRQLRRQVLRWSGRSRDCERRVSVHASRLVNLYVSIRWKKNNYFV